MTTITVTDENLIIEIIGLDKVWALKSQLTIPLMHVSGVGIATDAGRFWKGFRFPGTEMPGIIAAGNFYHKGNKVFWDVHNTNNAINISLDGDDYSELIIEVEDPEAELRKLQAALASRTSVRAR